MKKCTNYFFAFLFFFIISSSLLILNCYSQWILQPLPVSGNVFDIKFFDKNTGLISLENPLLIRTTNGGSNWQVLGIYRMYGMQIIDSVTLYAYGRPTLQNDRIYRTFNRGLTWDSVAITGYSYLGISFINKDTGWVSGFDGGSYRVWKTTNGGISLIPLTSTIGKGKVFFLRYKINGEYYGWCSHDVFMYKTTTSGNSWFLVASAGSLHQLEFTDENTGWSSNGGNQILKTTNGGLNWTAQTMPEGNGISFNLIDKFAIVKNDTLYGDYGSRYLNGRNRGIIWKTTNGGLVWGFQQPDTSYIYTYYDGIDFPDSINGWSYSIHTSNTGGIITGINPIKTEIPKTFELSQNYPNPFNPQTTIEFSISKSSYASLNIYDITGKEILKIFYNKFFGIGNYKTVINLGNMILSSGFYIYILTVHDDNGNQIYFGSRKMLYLK